MTAERKKHACPKRTWFAVEPRKTRGPFDTSKHINRTCHFEITWRMVDCVHRLPTGHSHYSVETACAVVFDDIIPHGRKAIFIYGWQCVGLRANSVSRRCTLPCVPFPWSTENMCSKRAGRTSQFRDIFPCIAGPWVDYIRAHGEPFQGIRDIGVVNSVFRLAFPSRNIACSYLCVFISSLFLIPGAMWL